jgi:hypothetical protein
MSYEPPTSGNEPGYPQAYQPPAPPQPPTYQAPAAQPPSYPQQAQAYQPPAPQPYQPAAPQNPPYMAYTQSGYNAQGYPVSSYPGYGGVQQPPSAGVGGIAIAAIIVSGVAFLGGWIPFIGLIIAVVGLVLSILAIRSGRGRVLGIIGTILSALALLTGAFILFAVFAFTTSDFGSDGYGAAPAAPPHVAVQEALTTA